MTWARDPQLLKGRSIGTVTSAVEIAPDGTEERLHSLPDAIGGTRGNLIELGYAYCPDLLPQFTGVGGMWQYRDLLPLDLGPIQYPLAIGGTPLISPAALRAKTQVDGLYLKDETRSPTGSNKDRATALVLEHALRHGLKTVTAASTGNVAVSLAVGCAAAGLEAVIFVPADVGEGKLRVMLAVGATVFRVVGGYESAFRLSRESAQAFGWVDRNTGINPLTVEAKKTVAFEIWEQLGRTVPHVVVVPVGDGTTLTAAFKGFRELVACGVADSVPRMIAVQAAGCRPLATRWRGGPEEPSTHTTIADGIAVTVPINGVTAVRDVRASGGAFVTVTDDEILRAVGVLASRAGVLAEPAAAASYAGLEAALRTGIVTHDETVVLLITGSGLKTQQFLPPSGDSHIITPDLSEVQRVRTG